MLKSIKKYFLLYVAMFKASFISDLEYRANFLTRIITDIFWYIAQITTFEVLYKHTERIGDWNVHQMRVFLGLLFVVDAMYMLIVHDNLENLSEKVRKGDLDLLLAKPVNSQFMMSLQRAATASLGNLALSLGWLFYSLAQLPEFSYWRLLWLIVLLPCGILVVYTIKFVFATLAVIFTKADSVLFLWWQIYKIGMRPDSMYFPWFRWIILTVIPVGVVASIPARALLDPPNLVLLLWPLILAPLLIYLSNLFWNYALKFYSSASS